MRRLFFALLIALAPACWAKPTPLQYEVWPWNATIYAPDGTYEAGMLDAGGREIRLRFDHPLCLPQDVHLSWEQANAKDVVVVPPVKLQPQSFEARLQIMWEGYKAQFLAYALAAIASVVALIATGRRLLAAHARRQTLGKFEAARDRHDSLLMQTIGGYRLVEILGSGGMATVYRALPDKTLDEREARAVKVLSREIFYSSEFRKRFEREVSAYKRLSHPHILKIYDWSVPDDLNVAPYMMLELVQGKTLRQLMPLSWNEAKPWLEQLFQAMHYAHQQGVIHRDLKPENIMVDKNGVKVMDFGLARHDDASHLTATGTIMGTPAYMAPEQLGGGTMDARLDQYALGVIAYEILTGRLPYQGEDTMQLLAQILSGQIQPSRLDEKLDAVLMRMLAREPKGRFADVAETWAALASH